MLGIYMYSDLYFKDKIQPLVNAAMEREPELSQLKHYHHIRAECWAGESLEVREEVQKVYNIKHNASGNEEDD